MTQVARRAKAPRRAGVYVRISRDSAGLGLGVARQERDRRELADRLGWEVLGDVDGFFHYSWQPA